ncbi:hypothetical protein H6G33_24975 [Calothrix sp. FACHB-1219]|uniref:hypothetical protein n=1 Tax=unclassified Calothrix TaxID=2619626 RepID=UPI0016896AD9|nr:MULTISPECIES: hypothetical protein [unclassified Calothrix]MBD2205600.1 hypothetical protein [Calothrix sp. FACHB-168]MBD2220263.1 hypothetical protein [Calothrix sp. FACHB-1219]
MEEQNPPENRNINTGGGNYNEKIEGDYIENQHIHPPRQSKQVVITAEDFFRPLLNAKNLFNHTWSLVGRTKSVEEIHKFVESEQQRVAILTGRGGIGKTKLLHTFAQQFDEHHQQFTLRFLMQGEEVPITMENLEELPIEPCVIVVDDAHQRDDLSVLLAFVRQNSHRFKLIFSSRPQAIDFLHSRLTRAEFDSREVREFEILKELSRDEVKELAIQVLSNEYAHYAERLAIITRDCPLITVIGGKLLAEKKVDPLLLERDEEFRNWILKRFQDEYIGKVSEQVEPQLCHKLLQMIAATAPIRLTNEEFKQVVVNSLGIDKHTLVSILGILETSGILLRRGDTLRITPDVLSDYILHEACLTKQGDLTGYAQQVFNNFMQICPEQVLRNLAELDWRIYHTNGEETNLLAEIWRNIKEEFQKASNFDRCQMLNLLKGVAYYQPRQVLELVEFAMRNPATAADNDSIPQLYRNFTHTDVQIKLPAILERIGYTLDYLPRCCDLLWELAKNDKRELNPYPEHPIRILTKLAKYDIYKSLEVNRIVLDSVARWLKKPNVHNYIYSPLDVLEPLLDKNSHSTRSEGLTLKSTTFAVSREKTESIREKAISLIQQCATSEQVKVSRRALDSLSKALQEPQEMVGLEVSDEQREEWIPEQLQILEFLSQLVQKIREPLIHLKVIEILKWHIHLSYSSEVRQKALEIINLIPDTYDFQLIGVLTACDTLDWFISNRGTKDLYSEYNWQEKEKRIQDILSAVVREFLKRHPDANEGVRIINEKLIFLQESGIEINRKLPDFMGTYRLEFLQTLATNAEPEYVIQFCEAIIKEPNSNLAPQLSLLLWRVRQFDIHRAIKIAQIAIDTESSSLCISIAEGCRTWLNNLQSEDIELIKRLLAHKDIQVRGCTIHSLCIMRDVQPQFVTAMVLSTDINDSTELASALCGIFYPEMGLSIDTLSDTELKILLQKLEPILNISSSTIGKFVACALQRSPRLVIQFLLKRIENAQFNENKNYQAIPFSGLKSYLNRIEKSSEYEDILREIRNQALKVFQKYKCWLNNHNHYISKLFEEVSLGLNATSIKVLEEWINSEDCEKIQTVSSFLNHAPQSFVLTHVDFTANLLEQAYSLGDECYKTVNSHLYSRYPSASDVRVVFTPEEPIPEDVALHNQALAIAKQFPTGSPVHKFYSSLAESAKASIKFWQKQWEEELG